MGSKLAVEMAALRPHFEMPVLVFMRADLVFLVAETK